MPRARKSNRLAFTRAQLYARMWTDEDIDNLLGDPDTYTAPPYHHERTVPRWYARRAEAIEGTEAFPRHAERLEQERMRKAPTDIRQKRGEEFLAAHPVKIILIPTQEQMIAGIHPTKQYGVNTTLPNLSVRKMFNHLRHQYTNYDEVLNLARKEGIVDVVYERIYRAGADAVVGAFPDLKAYADQYLAGKFSRAA